MTIQSEWLTVPEAASYLRIGRATLYRWVRQGRLRLHHVGARSTRLRRIELEQLALSDASAAEDPWHAVSTPAFAKDWDNPADAVYDNWRERYGVRER
jgi:excisionase family DNA binding protein